MATQSRYVPFPWKASEDWPFFAQIAGIIAGPVSGILRFSRPWNYLCWMAFIISVVRFVTPPEFNLMEVLASAIKFAGD